MKNKRYFRLILLVALSGEREIPAVFEMNNSCHAADLYSIKCVLYVRHSKSKAFSVVGIEKATILREKILI